MIINTYIANEDGQPLDANGEILKSMPNSLSNGNEVLVFDTAENLLEYVSLFPNVWSKEGHLRMINAAHEAEFKKRIEALDYLGEWEVVSAANDSTNQYYAEAVLLMKYWWDGYEAIKLYSTTVTEQTAINFEQLYF